MEDLNEECTVTQTDHEYITLLTLRDSAPHQYNNYA